MKKERIKKPRTQLKSNMNMKNSRVEASWRRVITRMRAVVLVLKDEMAGMSFAEPINTNSG